MSTHTMKLNKEWFDFFISRSKEYEIRLFDFKRELINVGDFIEFISDDTSLILNVIEIIKYNTFRESLEDIGVEKVLPGVLSIDEGVEIYHNIPGYKEGEEIFGVVAFKLV